MIVIASYPRSGNHLVRFLVEFITGRATLGCVGNPRDRPICSVFTGPQLEHVDLGEPIGIKAHFPREIRTLLRGPERPAKLVLILRDPVEAILSHAPRKADETRAAYLWRLGRQARHYRGLVRAFRRWPGQKLCLRYEALVGEAKGPGEVARLVDFLGEACIASKRDYALENLSLLRKTYSDVGKPKTMRGFTSLGDVGFYGRRARRTIRLLLRLATLSASPDRPWRAI